MKLQADVRPFLMAIAKRHPDTVNMSTEEAATYVETVLINIFFKHRYGTFTVSGLHL